MLDTFASPTTAATAAMQQQPEQQQQQQQPPRLLSPPPLLLRHAIGSTVTPGDRLGLVSAAVAAGNNNDNKVTLIAGRGTYIRQGHLYASLLGTVCAENPVHDASTTASHRANRWIISIRHQQQSPQLCQLPSSSTTATNMMRRCPKVNAIVLGRISRVILPTHAVVDIVAILAPSCQEKYASSSSSPPPFIIPLCEPFSGILRQQDLRPKSSLEIRIDDCYRPGDVVLARIRHANDGGGGGSAEQRDFILSSAEAELGVIRAICEGSGAIMRPVSWKEMQCPVTLAKERRKVAKPGKAR